MTTPVWSLDDFFPTYLALLEAGDADGLGLLYAEQAVLTSFGGPQGTSWSVGRDEIVDGLSSALKDFEVVIEVPSTVPYELRGGTLAGRRGTIESTITASRWPGGAADGAGVRGPGPEPDRRLAVPE